MRSDETRLRALFEAEDAALEDTDFSRAVMQRVGRTERTRKWLLVGASAFGAAIAASQLPELLAALSGVNQNINAVAFQATHSTTTGMQSLESLASDPPMWLLACVVAVVCAFFSLGVNETA